MAKISYFDQFDKGISNNDSINKNNFNSLRQSLQENLRGNNESLEIAKNIVKDNVTAMEKITGSNQILIDTLIKEIKQKSTADNDVYNKVSSLIEKNIQNEINREADRLKVIDDISNKQNTEMNRRLMEEKEITSKHLENVFERMTHSGKEEKDVLLKSLEDIGFSKGELGRISTMTGGMDEFKKYLKDEKIENRIVLQNFSKNQKKTWDSQQDQLREFSKIEWENHDKLVAKTEKLFGGTKIGKVFGEHIFGNLKNSFLNPLRKDGKLANMALKGMGGYSNAMLNKDDLLKGLFAKGIEKITKEGSKFNEAAKMDQVLAKSRIQERKGNREAYIGAVENAGSFGAVANKMYEVSKDNAELKEIETLLATAGIRLDDKTRQQLFSRIGKTRAEVRSQFKDIITPEDESMEEKVDAQSRVVDGDLGSTITNGGNRNIGGKNKSRKQRKAANARNSRVESIKNKIQPSDEIEEVGSTTESLSPEKQGIVSNMFSKLKDKKFDETMGFLHDYLKKLLQDSDKEKLGEEDKKAKIKNNDNILKKLSDKLSSLKSSESESESGGLFSKIKGFFGKGGGKGNMFSKIGGFFGKGGKIGGLFSKMGGLFKGVGRGIVSGIARFVPALISGIGGLVSAIGPALVTAAPFIAAAAAVAWAAKVGNDTYKEHKGIGEMRDVARGYADKNADKFGMTDKVREEYLKNADRIKEIDETGTTNIGAWWHGEEKLKELEKEKDMLLAKQVAIEKASMKSKSTVVSEIADKTVDITKEGVDVAKAQKSLAEQQLEETKKLNNNIVDLKEAKAKESLSQVK